jgi:hypothetical protein
MLSASQLRLAEGCRSDEFRPGRGFYFALAGERIAGITGFAGDPELFTVFKVPTELD